MKKFSIILTVLLATVILVCGAISATATKWTDVPDNAWYTSAVVKANELGIMNGTSDTTFAPLKNLSRAEYVAILFRLAEGEANLPFTFTDVPDGVWYSQYVGWAESAGVITGYGNAETFGGTALITREQLMLMTSRFMDYMEIGFENSADAVEFKDADKISSWAAVGVEATRKAALITGDASGNFNPQNPATRAEIATIVVRYMNTLPKAVDAMHVKLENILDLVETKSGKHIILNFSGGADFAVNYYHDNSIRKQLFSQMGLSLDKYELVMNKEETDSIRSEFSNMGVGHFMIKQVDLAIKNKVTGDQTKTVKVSLMMKKNEAQYVTVDPDKFEHGFDTAVYNEALEKSLFSEGNIARLAEFFEKGENVTVGYIGGSITAGASALPGRSWAEVTQRWIEKHVDANAKYVNAGIGGTSSALGNFRLEKHIFAEDCDLVFVEFAVNDSQLWDFHQQTFEALIRRLLSHEDAPAVVVVLSACESTTDDQFAPMEAVCNYYDLPIVDVRRAVHYLLDNTEMTYYDYAPDTIHPYSFGHQIMGSMVINLLSTVKDKAATAKDDDLEIIFPSGEFFYGDKYYDVEIIEGADLPYKTSGWTLADDLSDFGYTKCISSTSSANILEFEFNGKGLIITTVKTSVYLEISVDGGDYVKVSAFDGTFAETKEICYFTDSGTHNVKVRLATENDGSLCGIVGVGILK